MIDDIPDPDPDPDLGEDDCGSRVRLLPRMLFALLVLSVLWTRARKLAPSPLLLLIADDATKLFLGSWPRRLGLARALEANSLVMNSDVLLLAAFSCSR